MEQREAVASLATYGMPATGPLSLLQLNDSSTLSDLEEVIKVAQEELMQEHLRERQAATKSERKRRELADKCVFRHASACMHMHSCISIYASQWRLCMLSMFLPNTKPLIACLPCSLACTHTLHPWCPCS